MKEEEINPQRENGHVDIANKIVEALAKTQLSGYESRVLWALFRETWGYALKDERGRYKRDEKTGWLLKRKTAIITSQKWCKLTNMTKSHVSDTLRRLRLRRIVTEIGNKSEWGFQKLYNQWLPPIKRIVPKNGNTYFVTKNGNTLTEIGNTLTEIGNKNLPKDVYSKLFPVTKKVFKESIKRNNTISKINFNYETRKWENITEEDIKDWSSINPDCNVKIELKHMRQWLLDDKRRAKKQYRRFITGWIKRVNKYITKTKISMEESLEKMGTKDG